MMLKGIFGTCTNAVKRSHYRLTAFTNWGHLTTRQISVSTFATDDLNDDETNSSRAVNNLLRNNRRWVQEEVDKDPDFLVNLAKPQKPKYLYLGCSDSRVPANEILGLGAGEVFVHRNIGNLLPGNDLNALSVLEYAVGHLNVTDIIVTGHYDCGAVRAATSRQDLGMLENWLRQIRDVYRLHKDYLDLISDEHQRHLTLVELNVVEQCLNAYKTGIVQRSRHKNRTALLAELNEKALAEGQPYSPPTKEERRKIEAAVFPRIHGLVFNPADGLLKKLPVNFARRVGSLDHIYGLYNVSYGGASNGNK